MGGLGTQASIWPSSSAVPFGILSSCMTAVEDHSYQAPLLREMERRRLASLGTPNPIRQTVIAKELGWAASTVNRYANGERDLRNLNGTDLFTILTGYQYTPSEIEGIVTTYGLNYPPELLNRAGSVGMVMVLHEGSISQRSAPTPVEVPEQYLKGQKPELVTLRTTAVHDLVTPAAAETIGPHTLLVVSSRRPRPESFVIVEQDGNQALIKWPLKGPTWAMPYKAGGKIAPMLLDPHRIVPVAVVITGTTEFPH